jgi:hypothetical protein
MGSSAESHQRISFRPMGRSDLPQLQKWLASPHVAAWWNELFDLVSLDAKFRPRIDGSEPIYMYLILFEDGNGSRAVIVGWIVGWRCKISSCHSLPSDLE